MTASRSYHHGDLHASLLDAAEALLEAAPERQLTLREVAKSADVSHAAPYHHFAGLADLLAAIAARGFADLAGAMEGASRAESPREALVAICETYVDFARATPARFRLMFGPMLARKAEHPELKQAAEDAFEVLMQASAAFSGDNGAALALTGWSLAHGLANLVIDGAFDDLPVAAPPPEALARMMALQVLK